MAGPAVGGTIHWEGFHDSGEGFMGSVPGLAALNLPGTVNKITVYVDYSAWMDGRGEPGRGQISISLDLDVSVGNTRIGGDSCSDSAERDPYSGASIGCYVMVDIVKTFSTPAELALFAGQTVGIEGDLSYNYGGVVDVFVSGETAHVDVAYEYDAAVAAVPEPGTWTMAAAGLAFTGLYLLYRRQQ